MTFNITDSIPDLPSGMAGVKKHQTHSSESKQYLLNDRPMFICHACDKYFTTHFVSSTVLTIEIRPRYGNGRIMLF